MIATIGQYVVSVFAEGIMIGILFWMITYITLESSSVWVAIRSSVIAEVVGNVPYLWGIAATDPPAIATSLMAAIIFVYLVSKVGELSGGRAAYGTAMTYFVLVALVTCNA